VSTIRDIARMAGVSVSTASLALNGDPRVRPQTRSRVEEAAATLDYHPLRAARSLSSGRTWSLHLLNPGLDLSMSSGFFTRFVRGIHDAARDRGYGVALSVPSDEDEARSILRRLVSERWADGVVLMNPSEHDDVLEDVVRTGFPHVLLGRSPVAGVSSVDNDNERAAFDAATHLLSRGRRDLLLVNGPARHTFTQDRARGFLRALTASGADADAGRVLFGDGSADAARRRLGERLDRGQAVDGLVAVSDSQALGAMRALAERGFLIPDQVAVVGMNNDDLTEFTSPRLTSVELNAYDLGRAAVELLLEAIDGPRDAPRHRRITHRLVERDSSPPAPRDATPPKRPTWW
jgi:DNA-binding LacI/PurR family transcriptional regulator